MDPQAKYERLLDSARSHQSAGTWLAFAGIAVIALALAWEGLRIYRKGLQVTRSKTVTGPPAKVFAVVLVVASLGLLAGGLFYFPGVLR